MHTDDIISNNITSQRRYSVPYGNSTNRLTTTQRRSSYPYGSSPNRIKRVSIDGIPKVFTDHLGTIADKQEAEKTSAQQDKPNSTKLQRCRRRLSVYLHTHVALILVSTMAALDAAFVIGQIICDILIMKESISNWEDLDKNLTSLLKKELPFLNASAESQSLSLQVITNILWSRHLTNSSLTTEAIWKTATPNSRSRRAAAGTEAAGHSVLYELTHSFHLGSMIILSGLLLETFLKVFSMGKRVLHHKLEVFDAFVVSVSWALDVGFYEGIWAQPGSDAATLLIIILPWRVIRIVNSFVLVIQEKDHVQLKIVKQRLRLSLKRTKDTGRKASSYRTEVKQLQGLCRKYGASENEINACGQSGRSLRRNSVGPAMERVASLTLISALGSHPSLYTMDSGSDDEYVNPHDLTRTVSYDTTLRSAFSSETLDSYDVEFSIESRRQSVDDLRSDNENTEKGLDNPVFIDDEAPPLSVSTPGPRHRFSAMIEVETECSEMDARSQQTVHQPGSKINAVSENSSDVPSQQKDQQPDSNTISNSSDVPSQQTGQQPDSNAISNSSDVPSQQTGQQHDSNAISNSSDVPSQQTGQQPDSNTISNSSDVPSQQTGQQPGSNAVCENTSCSASKHQEVTDDMPPSYADAVPGQDIHTQL